MICHTTKSEGLCNRFLFGEKGRKRKLEDVEVDGDDKKAEFCILN